MFDPTSMFYQGTNRAAPNYDMSGMFNPAPMASQGQPGMQPTPAAQVPNRSMAQMPQQQAQSAMPMVRTREHPAMIGQ